MVVANAIKGLVSVLVIMVLILPQIAAQVIPPADSPSDNAPEQIWQLDNTVRVDPLDNFRKYKGGFDITNKHYWSSVIFTGVYGYAIGILFLLCGTLYGGYLLVTTKFYGKSEKPKRVKNVFPYKSFDLSIITLAILLTILAIVATGLVLAGSARFHSEAESSVGIIIKTANEASETINNTAGALKDMESNLMEDNVNNAVVSVRLDSTTERLDDASANIEKEASKNRLLINKGLKLVFVITIVIMSFNLVAVTVLSVSGVLRLRRALYLLITLCWLMTVICWIFFGIYFFLEKFSGDACTALDNFQENPYNNSLSSILPCDELLSAKSVLSGVSAGIYNLVNKVNENISGMQATSYPNLVHVCNPFSAPPEYLYQPQNCPANTIRIGDIAKVLKPFTCSDGTCGSESGSSFIISGSEYVRVEAFTSSIQDLLNVYPSMENLLECQIVKDAFSEILVKHCNPLKRYAKMVWSGMVLVSVIMLVLVLLWTLKAHVEPHCATQPSNLELGSTKVVNNNYNNKVVFH
ncbi:hypothetical protein HN51_018951 [Arachis hypogaea]|uniref:Transmembrane protein n=1 Tax=Arachis hypogaea TaxID=3818 RepID=A0A445BVI8_ARAHY|nr:uncharacterized protein LOC112706579 [Arachis hypogaea]QHO30563.1 uncharacterized protein DS421_8g234350 [Arachis hypogaea]RYR42561.1 hypothetical protein Ahy_A08g039025 [Arachis hypogaea]